MDEKLFDAQFLRKLEYLKIVSRRLHRGERRGDHETYRRGTSLEFADYRSYQSGDDFRYIDWNIYSRLDRLLVKLFTAEEDLTLQILLDTSRSMSFGNPPKSDYARRIAAALGYIALANLDRVGVVTFNSDLGDQLPAHRSRRHIFALFDYLSRVRCEGETGFNRSLASFSLRAGRGGRERAAAPAAGGPTVGPGGASTGAAAGTPAVVVVISDLLDENGFEEGLKALLYRSKDVVLIQVLDVDEIDPRLGGAYRLIDSENGAVKRVTVDSAILEIYRRKVDDFFRGIEDFCLTHGIEYLRTNNQVPVEDLVLKYLRQGMHLH